MAKETEWIRVKHKNKKHKMNKTPSPGPQKKNIQTSRETEMDPPIVVNGIKSYEDLYDLMREHISENTFQMKLVNDSMVKINYNESYGYKEAIRLLKERNIIFLSYENKKSMPIRAMAKNLHHSCNPDAIGSFLTEKEYTIISASNKLPWKDKRPLNMFMLTYSNDENIERIIKISHILLCKVKPHISF